MNNKETEEANTGILSPDEWYKRQYPFVEYRTSYYSSSLGQGDGPLWPEEAITAYSEYFHTERLKIDAPSEEEIKKAFKYYFDGFITPVGGGHLEAMSEDIFVKVFELLTKGKS